MEKTDKQIAKIAKLVRDLSEEDWQRINSLNKDSEENEKKAKSFEKSIQPCWTCQKAVFGCIWSREFKPIEGWEAEQVLRKTDTQGDCDIGYKIIKCPEYLEDGK